MKPKPTIALLLALSLLFIAGLVRPDIHAAAQTDVPQMTVRPAHEGYFKYGEWLPVWVELENQGKDLEGEVRIEVNSSQGLLVFASPVSLPSGSRKLVPVYVLPNNFSRELVVNLVSQGKSIISEKVAVHPQPNISFFVGLLAPEHGALSLINGIKLPGQERPIILVDLTIEDIVDRPEAMRSFDLLVLNDLDTSQLTPAQKSSLSVWVQQGGHLVIGGGASAQRTLAGLSDPLVPILGVSTIEVQAEKTDAIAAYAQTNPFLNKGPFVVARGDLTPGSQVISGSSDLPLIIQKSNGSGIVHFIALDLAAAPFNGWPGTQTFWEKTIGPGGSYPENMPFDVSPRQYRANSLFYALSNIPSLDLPSIKGVLILLGIYILIIGPINYLILRWRKRLHLAWITIPALTALFTAGSFGIGYTMRGNDLVLNKIALVQVDSSGNAAVTSYMGLFSPRQQSYEVMVNGNGLLSPMSGYDSNPWGGAGVNTTGGEMVFLQGQPARLKGLTVNQWAMQSFMSETTWQDFGRLTGDLTLENDTLIGVVRNESSYTLTDVVVIMQNRFARLGDLAPGDEKEVNLGLENLTNDRFGPPLSYRLFQENINGVTPSRATELKTNIVSSVFENTPSMKFLSSRFIPSGGMGSNGIILMGWLNQAPPEVSVAGSRLSYQTTAMVYTDLNYKIPEKGYLTLPPGLLPGSITKYPVEGGTCGTPTSVNLGRGNAELDFYVPEDLDTMQITTLKLALSQDNGMQLSLPKVELFQWENKTWTEIQDPIQGTNVIQNAAPYISNHTVRIRISNDTANFACVYLDMGLEAERASGQGGSQ